MSNPHYLDATDLEGDDVGTACDNCDEVTTDVRVVSSSRIEAETGYRQDDALLCASCRRKFGMRG